MAQGDANNDVKNIRNHYSDADWHTIGSFNGTYMSTDGFLTIRGHARGERYDTTDDPYFREFAALGRIVSGTVTIQSDEPLLQILNDVLSPYAARVQVNGSAIDLQVKGSSGHDVAWQVKATLDHVEQAF